jgi:hypothetical protein
MAAAKIKNQNLKSMSTIQTNQQKAQAKIQSERQKLQTQVGQSAMLTSPLGAAAMPGGGGQEDMGAEEIPFE